MGWFSRNRNNKIGNNDNTDLGSNKNNKSKQIVKNSTINYPRNENTQDSDCYIISKTMADLACLINGNKREIWNCEDCKNGIDKYLNNDNIDYDEKCNINDWFNDCNHWYNYPKAKLIKEFLCQKHRKLFDKIEDDIVRFNIIRGNFNNKNK